MSPLHYITIKDSPNTQNKGLSFTTKQNLNVTSLFTSIIQKLLGTYFSLVTIRSLS